LSRTLHWLSPGDPGQRTGGYIYNARMVAELRDRGWTVEVHVLPGAWPWPCGVDLQECRHILAGISRGAPVLADGLLWPGLGKARDVLTQDHPVLVLVHSLLDKEGQGDHTELMTLEQEGLMEADGWIGTSPATGRLVAARLGDDGTPGRVVCPGTDPAAQAPGTEGHNLLCVATVTPRKGIRLLIEAVSALEDTEWCLDIVGALDRDEVYAASVRADIDEAGLGQRVQLHGELAGTTLEEMYQQADVLVHAAHFEAYGMGLAEAIARSIPVISTPAGALEGFPPEAVKVVPAGDAAALTQALDSLLSSPDLQHRMGAAAASAQLATWPDAAQALEKAVVELL